MKKIFSFTKKKKQSSGTPDNGSVLSFGYDLKDKDLGKVHKAASVGDLAKLKQLAKKNDINQLDKENRTALHIACASGHVEVVQFLVESKAKLNLCDNQNRSALMKAVQGQHERCVSTLLENHAEPNLVDINGNTALHLAANIPSISTAVLLLEHEADINAQNKEAFTPLSVAVREDHIEMAEFLLKEGANVNSLDQDQRSPLMIAAGNGQIGMLRLLLRFGADIKLKDTKGWSADDYAVMNGHHPCSLLIIEHSTQRSDGQSLPLQGPSKKMNKTHLGSPSQDIEAGFSLGGPATDKDDLEDNSQSESLSRVSKSADDDDWPSSEDDDESVLIKEKPQRVNLRKMIASKRGEASALPDRSWSGTESEPENENRVQKIPSLPKAVPSSKPPQHPIDPSPVSFPSKAPRMTSTPLPGYSKVKYSAAERGKSKLSEQPSSSKARAESREESPEAEDSEDEVGEEEEEEEEEDDEEEEDEEEDDEDDDDDDDDEEEEDEEDEDDDDESEEDDVEDDEEENECEEDDENCSASVKAKTSEHEDIEKLSVTGPLEITDRADPQNIPAADISCSSETIPVNVAETSHASEDNAKTETQKNDGVCPARLPATLDVVDDCVVSAIRVESKFSDEDESLGKECMWTSDQKISSGVGSTGRLTPSRQLTGSCSPAEIKEEESEGGMEKDDDDDDDDNTWSNKQNSGDTVWNDSDDEEDNQRGGFGRSTVLAHRRKLVSKDLLENKDASSAAEDDVGSTEASKEKKRRSSWGSSLEDSDNELPKEDEANKDTLDQKSGVQGADLQDEAATVQSKCALPQSNEDHPDTSWDSPSAVSQSPKSVLPQSVSPSQSKNRPAKATADESEWDSLSENNDQNDNGSFIKGEVLSPVSKTNTVTGNQPEEQHSADDSWEEEEEEEEENVEESNDPSPAVSPVSTRRQIPDISHSSQMAEKADSENEKGDDSDWDDEDESDKSEKQKDDEAADKDSVIKTHLSTSPNAPSPKSRPTSAMDKKLKEEAEVGDIKGGGAYEKVPQSNVHGTDEFPESNRLEEEKLVGGKTGSPRKDDDSSSDSDSKDQKLQYNFASATVKVFDVGDDSDNEHLRGEDNQSEDEHEARLTAYVPLENKSAIVRPSSDNLSEETPEKRIPSSHVTVGQRRDSDRSILSDEVLPQTDIDDVDLDSPDEAESIGVKNTEEPATQKEDSTNDEDDDDKDEERDEEEEEEGDTSDENDQPEESGESLDATAPPPETEVSKDKKRDFLSELGLEKGEEEQDSWDSESNSENRDMPDEEKQSLHTEDQEEMSTAEEEIKKIGHNKDGDNGDQPVDKDDTTQKEQTEKTKWEPLSVLSKLDGEKDQKTDVMEEFGLGDVDDLEASCDNDTDPSDWDSASTTSKRTLPGRTMASPGLEDFPERSNPSVKEHDEDVHSEAPTTPRRSISSNQKQPSTPPQPVPHPQPRARTMLLQKPESEEESDWEQDNLMTSGDAAKIETRSQNISERQAAVRPGSPGLSPMATDSKNDLESEKQKQKEKDDAVDTCQLDLDNPHYSDQVGSESDLKDQHSHEEKGDVDDGVLWEKRYEKLWVEVEKRDLKSTFKDVAGELKEKFGELLQSRCPAEDITEEEQAMAESASAEEEESSDEDEGEIIVRPTARARRTVLLTIPEQRESGLEDSVTESTDKSEDRMQVCERPPSESSICHEADLLTDDGLEGWKSPSPQLAAFTDDHTLPRSDVDGHTSSKDEAELGPVQKPHVNLVCQEGEAETDSASSEGEGPEEFPKSCLPSLSRRPAAIPGVSDEELEEDMERFNLEVGMLKVVFLDLEKEKAQLQKEAGKETAKTAVEVQKSRSSWDSGEAVLEEVGTQKPETRLGCLSSEAVAVHQEQQPAASKSTNEVPVQLHLPLQQTYSSNKQEVQAGVETLQLELVRGARGSRAPQTNTHVNGDPLSVFDDSTLSEVSDDEGRLPTTGPPKNKNPEEVEMAEDFDELTQSSDTATDDIDSPTSGYHHASLLIQKLDSATLDSRSMVKLQNIFHEYERSIQKAKSRHGYLADKVSQLEMERAELKSSLEEVKDFKSGLERNQLELQTEVTNLKFQLKQEQENRRNATMMYNTARDKLRRTEDQHQLEVQERQKVELTLRNLELEMRTLVNNMKQLEEDHSETQRLLAQERSARALQENLLNSHLRKQQEIEDENKRNISKSNEALSQLTEATDRERDLLQQNTTLQDQLTILRTDLECLQANNSLKESHLLEENEALKEQIEDARRDLKLNSEALTQTVFNCNNQVTTLKSELAITTTRLENERQTRETLETEIESTRSRLAGAVKEAELCLVARTESERALLREKEEHQRLKDRLTGEAASQREAVNSLSQKLAKAEAHANSMENEVHRATMQLTEKGLLLEVLQREKDQATARVKELETTLQAEREQVSRAGARQEATQERLAQAQSEGMLLRQQLEEAQNKGVAKERAVTDAQERFSDILSKLRSDCEDRVQLVEERNKELASKAADLRDQIYKLEEEKNERETSLRQLQQELADSLKKLSMSEASLEVNTRYRNDLEEEKARLLKEMDRLKGKLEESEDRYVQAERRINSLKSSLDEKEKELTTAAQKLQEALSASAASDITIKQLEEAVQRLEIENARLEAAAKQQSNKIDALQKGAQEAAMVRGRLEDLVTNLQSSKMTLEDQLSREVQKQSMLSHTAQDSQALWEEELKSRSKLGLRLAELEKEKGELSTQMEIEKKKAKKITEQKKAVDTRLDQEMKRNTELQKEMYRLRTLLKTAKKRLRDQDAGGAEFGSPMSSLRMDQGRMKDKVDDLQVQLEKEASRRSQLEKANGELKDQLASLKSMNRSNDHLERSKRQLEEEVLDLRRRMEAAQVEQSQVEQYRRDAEERARQEIQQKLEQVNLFLQSQAASQEALDQIKAANEVNLRSQLEQKIRELEAELGRARTSHHDSLSQRESTRTELERYRQLYSEEMRLRKSLAAKLDRANSRLSEANSKLLNERSRSLITSSIANGSLGGPSLDVGSLGSPAQYGATLGPLNRSLGLGLSLLSPVTEGQNTRVEDYLAKMQSELDRNISKELNNATAELDAASARMSPVGSASRVELDPVSRATQQYLEVLKKNNMI